MDPTAWVTRFKSAAKAGFVLDFDGTLSRVVAHPDEAKPIEGATQTLEKLRSSYEVVALVSGREAQDLHDRVAVPGIRYIGLYGAEELINGELRRPAEAEMWRSMASRLARDAEAMIATEGLEGCEVEYKDLAVSIHYRNARDMRVAEAIKAWAQPAAQRRRFQAGAGRKVVELRPLGVSKGGAFERVVKEHKLDLALLAGDDQTDLEAMIKAKSLMNDRVFRVGVRSAEEPAGLTEHTELLVGTPEMLVDFLSQF